MKGHVRERGKGNWYAIISVRDNNGKRKSKWLSLPGAKGKREAQEECARIITERHSLVSSVGDKTTLAAFLERWLIHIQTQVSPRTHQGYAEIVHGNLVPALGTTQLSKLQPAHISAAYAQALASGRKDGTGGLSPRSVHHMHRVLVQALKQAQVWRLVAQNPASLVKPPKVERTEMRTLDTDQTADMIDLARDTRLFPAILLGVLCGLRRGEITALRWRSVDLDLGQLSVVASTEQINGCGIREKEPKSRKGRALALSAVAVSGLRQWRVQQAQELLRLGVRLGDDHHVVMNEDGNPVQPQSLTRAFRTFMHRHGLPVIRLHDLRHSHATHMLSAGIHPKVAQERLGHSSIGITLDLYSHSVPGMQQAAVATLDAALQSAMDKRRKG